MRPRTLLLSLALLLWVGAPSRAAEVSWTSHPEVPFLRGAVLGDRWDGSSVRGDDDLDLILSLARHGADTVALPVVATMADPHSPFLADARAGDERELARLVRNVGYAHSLGMRVVVLPRVQLQTGEWSGEVRMRDEAAWRKWFASYAEWLRGWAHWSQRAEVDFLGVGSEMVGTTHREEDWRRLVRLVRREYSGPVLYAADPTGEFEQVQFWDELDLIGLDGPPPMRTPADEDPKPRPRPSVWSAADADSVICGELVTSLRPLLDRIDAVARRAGRPVVFTRVGYRSRWAPWTDQREPAATTPADGEADQRRALLALELALRDRPWWRGTLWSPWDLGPPPLPASDDEVARRAWERERREWQSSPSLRGKEAHRELERQWREPPLGWAAHRVTGRGGAVVSGDSLATAVGIEVLREGGNAVDAAVAVALALAVTMPEAGNLGGGGFLLFHDPRRERTLALDFRETAPLAAYDSLYVDLAAEGQDRASRQGPLAAGIPGSPAGLHAIWRREGSLPWNRLVRPAFRLAAEGFALGQARARIFDEEGARLRAFAASRTVFYPEGRAPREGERLVQPALAQTLLRLMREGPGDFYVGHTARELVHGVRAAGGIWTEEDLARYRPRWLEPIRIPLEARRRVELFTMPPPSSAGVVLGQSWDFLARQRADLFEPRSVERARAWVEALRLAFADRNAHLGDPESMHVSPTALLQPRYLRQRARLLPEAGTTGRSDWIEAGEPGPSHEHTTHIAVIDAQGRCVSLTTTLNDNFGSGFLEASTGILLNDQMDDFDTRPGQPNLYGLVGRGANGVRPGVRMLSSMSPCIVLREGEPWLVLGGRGGPRIHTAVAQILWARVVDDWPLDRAVSAPRLHHQWLPDRVFLEEGRRWPGLDEDLKRMGYDVEVWAKSGKVHALERLSDGRLVGVADPRANGRALTVDPSP